MSGPRVGVVTFPGSLDDRDALRAVAFMGGDAVPLWHGDADLGGAQAVVLPGGFSYGDYLRTGAIARFAAIMEPIRAFVEEGGPVLGICNGFQILCEAGLLPGALIRNRGLAFVCRWVHVAVDRASPLAGDLVAGDVLGVPIKHGEGQFVASAEELAALEAGGRVAFRYASADGLVEDRFNPNGSANGIAGRVERGRQRAGAHAPPRARRRPRPRSDRRAADPAVAPVGGRGPGEGPGVSRRSRAGG